MAGSLNGNGGYVSVNGLELYYEIQGSGQPLVLLPGGFMTIELMGPLVGSLAETRQVIAVEPQGHGHTADIDRPFTYEQSADDTAALVDHLDLRVADVFGFSMGGGIAMQVAIRHPDLVRKLVVASAPCRSDGEYPEIRALMASFEPEAPMLTPMREAYVRTAPNPGDWPRLIAKGRDSLAEELDWSKDVAAMKAPTLIIVGDADTVLPSHAVEMFRLLGGARADWAMGRPFPSQLAILPGTTHFSILSKVDVLLAVICPFLDAPMPPAP